MSEISEIEIKSMTKEQNYIRGYRDGKSDVLDKIIAEIKERKTSDEYTGESILAVEFKDDILDIIDKYREEQGDEKTNS